MRFSESFPPVSGRPRMYRPRTANLSDQVCYKLLKEKICAANTQTTNVGTDFEEHCNLNEVSQEDPEALIGFVASLQAQGLAPSTVRTRIQLLQSYSWRKKNPRIAAFHDIKKFADARDATRPHTHALDLPVPDLLELTSKISDDVLRFAAILILSTGIRGGDLVHMSTSQFDVNDETALSFDVNFSKNVRRHMDHFTVRIPWTWIPTWPSDLLKFLRDESSNAFASVTTQKLNAELMALNGEVRTKTLRRAYIHSIIQQCTADDCVDWLKVKAFTGHSNIKVLQSSYQKRAAATRHSRRATPMPIKRKGKLKNTRRKKSTARVSNVGTSEVPQTNSSSEERV